MPANSARHALPFVLINGLSIGGVIEIEVQANSFFAADRFSFRAALAVTGGELWAGPSLVVEIRTSLDGDWASLITGMADSVTIDPIRGEVRVAGRDLTSLFVAAQIEGSFENQTSSDIANLLAARRGLSASVEPTDTLIGRYYQTSRTRTALPQHARAITEWDLLCWLAQLENFDVWVAGQTLYFQPTDPGASSLMIAPADCVSLSMHYALDISAGVSVTVKSWDSLSQSAIIRSASNSSDGSTPSNRTIVRPNLSSDEAQMLAERLVGQISEHQRTLVIDVPGDLVTAPRMIMALVDTNTDFDGQYIVCSVERRLTLTHGFTQMIEARSLPWMPS